MSGVAYLQDAEDDSFLDEEEATALGLGPEAGAGAGAGRALGSEKHSCSLLLRQLHLVMMVHITDATPELAPPNWHHLLGIT